VLIEGLAFGGLAGTGAGGVDVRLGANPERYRELAAWSSPSCCLKRRNVAVAGHRFGEYGDGHVRIALVENVDRIRSRTRHQAAAGLIPDAAKPRLATAWRCDRRSRQGDPHMTVAVFAEADARRHRDIRLFKQQLGELQAAQLAIPSGIGAQANIDAAGAGTGQPADAKPSISTSRRRL